MAVVIGVTGLAFEARIAADLHTQAICNGDGSTLAESLASAIAGDCCGLISFGVAGGLSPDLPAGACVVASTIISETIQLFTDRDWSQALLRLIPGSIYGPIAGVTTVAMHPEAKRSLHMSTGALAVDNESHVAASVAAARGLPMTAVRVIMDPAGRQLPAAALAAVRANGTIDLAALVRATMKQPSELPMLLRTGLDALSGFAALLRCRQLLGPGLGLPSLQADESEPSSSVVAEDRMIAL
ncbi:phosphorylase family protein [Bradyrhizobium elkanii]|uniref:phosphorylase family protein n=1 Tax=Bradyrhizobium elkanii TaxID=29448 RepID=UPI00056E9B95|nr:adenosylhopane nucleosidase [Bradyrhizobium elkanii]WLA82335.1 adenosylhopane nucleosidase [Bradyrhizobium elkanii]